MVVGRLLRYARNDGLWPNFVPGVIFPGVRYGENPTNLMESKAAPLATRAPVFLQANAVVVGTF
jgi:hypothetical protein